MSDPIAAYLEATARLDRITARCDGLVVDVRQRHEALDRWQAGVAARAPIGELETALTDFATGEPPSWRAVGAALEEWIARTEEASVRWNALSLDERAGLAAPLVRRPEADAGG